MKLSIVTPVYEDPRIRGALESVEAQVLPDDVTLERIVVDGGSGGETAEILDAHDQAIDVRVSEPDEGVYDAMNKGIEAAAGDVVGILNADDRYADDRVLHDVMEPFRDGAVDACYGDLVYVDDAGQVVRYWESGPFDPGRFRRGWMPAHPTFFVRRRLYEELGTFDLSYPIAADYELTLRFLYKHDVTVRYVDRVLVRMAVGGQSNASLGNIVQANAEVRRAWRDHDLAGGRLVPLLKPLRKLPQFLRSPPPSAETPGEGPSNRR